MVAENYQNLIIGSGAGGKIVGWNLAKQGQKTAVVERAMIGGSCPNVACLPSKNVIYSAKAVALVAPKTGLGVTTGQLQVNMPGVVKRKREMVDSLIQMHLDIFKATGAELIMGEARFVEPKTVEVKLNDGGTRRIRGERVFLGLGSRAAIPPVPGLVEAKPLTHAEAINLESVPQHLVVIGGGYVGLEFAQAMRRFGSRVTIIQRAKQLLDREDADIAAAVTELLRDEGVDVLLDAQLLNVSGQSALASRSASGQRAQRKPLRRPIFSSPPAGLPTPTKSIWPKPESNSMPAASSA